MFGFGGLAGCCFGLSCRRRGTGGRDSHSCSECLRDRLGVQGVRVLLGGAGDLVSRL